MWRHPNPYGSSVLEGLGDVVGLDSLISCEVGYGAGHPQDLAVATGGKSHALGGGQKQSFALGAWSGDPLQFSWGESSVEDAPNLPCRTAAPLALPGSDHTLSDSSRRFPRTSGLESFKVDWGKAEVEVDPVQ